MELANRRSGRGSSGERWKRTTDGLGERPHVGEVLGVRRVAEVGCDLVRDRAGPHGSTAEVSARRGAVAPPGLSVKLCLIASAIGREFYRMQINASPVRMPERDRGWQPVPDDLEALAVQQRSDMVDPARVGYEIELPVLSCLPSDQRIDTPPSIDPHDNLRRGEHVEDLQHLIGSHGDMLPAPEVTCGATLPAVGGRYFASPSAAPGNLPG